MSETTNKIPGAKDTSLIAQIIAAVWIGAWSAVKFASQPASIDIADVGLSGVLIAACFVPVYFSIIMDKIKDMRVGNGTSQQGGGK